MPIQYNGENLTSGVMDPVNMFYIVGIILLIAFIVFIFWALYNMIGN